MTVIKALIFDFDGLILDTEGPELQAWLEIYHQYGCVFPLSQWLETIGGTVLFDPCISLEKQLGRQVGCAAFSAQHRSRFLELLVVEGLLPGVERVILDAKQLGLRLGIASSSSQQWVNGHLRRFMLTNHFDVVICADDVERVKPDPALYLRSLEKLGVQADEAIAFEDSWNGILAAKRAGVFCVVVPGELTRKLPLDSADMRLSSLVELQLELLLKSDLTSRLREKG